MFASKQFTSFMHKTLILSFALIPSACSTTHQSGDSIRELDSNNPPALEEKAPLKETKTVGRSEYHHKKQESYTVGMPTIGGSLGPGAGSAEMKSVIGGGSGSLAMIGRGSGGGSLGALSPRGMGRMRGAMGSRGFADAQPQGRQR